ncbi:hypothetical protein [Jannaschia formosa]|uniref:hypothetical protein n=1 Tax=Jannaschia formosa TaxID=2259592 RepID=UPI000E1BDF5E|nr:hypothetical protein [Jannaschia formosa]TFL18438.1 hypothetical protein DR046_10120 [Jannaschia formosa]
MSLRLAAALAFCAVCTGSFAAAQTVPIRSGEHAAFTRLVFPARAGLGWSVARPAPDRVTLTFEDPGLALGTETVFDRIPRSRLAGIAAEGPRLTLDLACDCEVEVSQIGSGHIVMDIAPAPEVAAAPPAPVTAPPLRLPLRLPPTSALFAGFDPPASGRDAAPRAAAPSPVRADRAIPARAAQISIRTMGRTPFLPGAQVPEPEEVIRLACPEESLAADLFRQDPAAALDRIPALRAELVDGADRPVAAAYRALAEAYLASGLGAEAAQVLRLSPAPPDPVLIGLAEALDGSPDFAGTGAPFDPACGPATAVLALLTGVTPEAWGSVDTRAIGPFVDTLPKAARDDLLPRLRPALLRLGQPELLSLDPAPRDAPAQPASVAAGTDRSAVAATIAALTDPDAPASQDILANGLALRDSVPEGPLREELDRALAVALVLSGHLTEAVRVIDGRPDLAAEVLVRAARILPAEELAVAAIRLRPALAEGGPGAALAVETLRQFGLDTLAGGFGARLAPPAPAFETAPDDDPWIARDISRLDPETPRGRLAARRQARNGDGPPADDFARAASVIEDSARLSEAILSLIDAPG